MPSGETLEHRRLKALALTWAQANGLSLCATEVRVPRSNYRADVAACARGAGGATAIFECKQGRADLLKDAHAETQARTEAVAARERLAQLECLIAGHRPDLRRGESLFPEFDALDFTGFEHLTHRRVLADLAKWQQRILHGTKFARLFRWRSAAYLYLVAEEGIFAEAEVPAGWGLLVRRGGELELVRRPVWTEPPAGTREALLEAIALAATRAVNRSAGVVARPDGPGRSAAAPEATWDLHSTIARSA
jgi:hypothetical protein